MRYIARLCTTTAGVKRYSTRLTRSIPVDVDSLCIPLTPPYSLTGYLPSNAPPLSRSTLLHLHRLTALQPPTTEAQWKELDDLGPLAAIIEGIRKAEVQGAEGEMVDARVRGQTTELESATRQEQKMDDPAFGRSLLKLAQVTEGSYYTAPTPSNVRGKKRSGSSSKGEESAEE